MPRRIRFSRYFKKNKFGAKISKCFLEHNHRSGLESEYCGMLRLLQKSGEIKEFTYEPYFELIVNNKKICGIYPDFLIQYSNGVKAIHECKGIEMPDWRIKWKLLQSLYPDYVYQVIK